MPLYTSTWDLDTYSDTNARSITFTKEDNRQMQVLQNQLCRVLLNEQGLYLKQNLPTAELLHQCGDLSIHQLGAQKTILMMKKILSSQKPAYLRAKLNVREGGGSRLNQTIVPIKASLNISRNNFLYRGIKLFNQLPEELRIEAELSKFKSKLKTWVKLNIAVKP